MAAWLYDLIKPLVAGVVPPCGIRARISCWLRETKQTGLMPPELCAGGGAI